MKIKVSKDVLVAAINRVRSVSNASSSMPMLANVMISCADGAVTLACTDLEVSMLVKMDAKCGDDGSVAVSAKGLFDVVKNVAVGDVTIEIKDDSVVSLKAGRSKFKIPGMPGSDFPAMPDARGAEFFDMPSQLLGSLLSKTHYAASTDPSRPHLAGVHLSCVGGVVFAKAADNARVSRASADAEGVRDFSALVPMKGIGEIRGMLTGPDISMAFTPSYCVVVCNGATLSIKLADDVFPPVDKVIDHARNAATSRLSVDRVMLLDSIRRVEVVAGGKITPTVRADLTEGSLMLSATNQSVGEGSDTMDADYAGDAMNVCFSPRYLSDVASCIDDENIELALGGELDPIVITSGADFVAVIMPKRETD